MERFCNSCQTLKSLEDFYKSKNEVAGRAYHCKECAKKAALATYRANPQKSVLNNKVRRDSLRQEILKKFGNKCCRCGFDDSRALQIDHIYGGGAKELREFNSTYRYYKYLLSLTLPNESYQLLCANCNWIKKFERNENANGKAN